MGRRTFPKLPAIARLNLFVHAGFILTGIMTTLLGPMLPVLATRWELSDTRSGYLFLAQFIGVFFGTMLCGRLIQIRGFRFCFVAGFALHALGAACLTRGTWHVGLLSVATYGVGIGVSVGATNLWIGAANPTRRAAALSLVNCSWTVGAVASPALVAIGVSLRQLTVLLLLLAAAGAMLALAFMVSDLATPPSSAAAGVSALSKLPFVKLFSDRFAATFTLIFFLDVGAESALSGWLATYAHRLQSTRGGEWALMPSFFWGGLLLARIVLPYAIAKMPELGLFRAGLMLSTVGCSMVLSSPRFSVIAMACVVVGVGLGSIFPITMAWLTERYGGGNYRLAATVIAVGGLGGGVIPWVVGLTSAAFGSLRTGLVVPVIGLLAILSLSAFPTAFLPARSP